MKAKYRILNAFHYGFPLPGFVVQKRFLLFFWRYLNKYNSLQEARDAVYSVANESSVIEVRP